MAPGRYAKTPLHRAITRHPVLTGILGILVPAVTWLATNYSLPVLGGIAPSDIVEAVDGWGQAANRPHTPPAKPMTSIPGTGTYTVGTDIYAGTWKAVGAAGCWWEVSSRSDEGELQAFGYGSGTKTVVLNADSAEFTTISCSRWHLVDPAGPK